MEDGLIIPISLEFDESGNAANLSSVKSFVNEVNKILRSGAETANDVTKNLDQYPAEVKKSLIHLNSELAASKRNIERYFREVESIQTRLQDPKFLYFNGANGLKDVLVSNQAALQMELDKYTELSQAIRDLQTQETSEGQTAQSVAQQEVQAINDRVASYTHLSANIREAVRQTELFAYKSNEYAKADTSGLAKQYQSYQQILGNMSNIMSGKFKEDHDNIKSVQQDIKNLIPLIRDASKEIKDPESRAALKEQIKLFRQLQKETNNQNKGDNFGGNFMSRQIYYNLRQLRLFQSELARIKKNVDNLTRSIVSGFGKALKIIGTLALGFTNLRKASDKAKKSTDGFGKGLMSNFWTLLRYTLGIRSLFALMKRFRHALSEGMENLAHYADFANQQMSSVMTSLLYMKNSVAAAAQPFLNILAPALEYVSEVVSKLCFNIAQLVAALTGQSFVYKATRAQVNYAKSLDKSSKSAKDLKEELASYDKLDVITKDKDNGGGDDGMPDPSAMFETISPISEAIQKLADKIKDIMRQLFAPIKEAWATKGQFVMDAWKYALDEIWALVKSIGRDFLKMWQEEATVTMWENIFHIIGDIGLIIGNIAKNIREAWDENERGLHIWEHIRDIVAILIAKLKDLADYTVEWSSKLDFTNLLDSFDNMLVALQPVADALGQLAYDIVKNVFLEYIKYLIEEGIPKLNDAISSIAEAVHWDQLVTNLEPLEKAIEKLMEASFDGFVTALEKVGKVMADFINSPEFAEFLENIANFISEVADSGIIEKVFEAIGLAIEKVAEKLAAFVNSPGFQEFLDALVDWFNSVSAEDLANALIAIGGGIAALTGVFTVGGWVTNFMTFVNTFATFLGFLSSAGGPLLIIGGLITAVASFVDMFKNGWNVISTILEAIGIAVATVAVIILAPIEGVGIAITAAIAAVVFAVSQIAIYVHDHWEELKQNIQDAINWFTNGLSNLGNLISLAFTSIKNTISSIVSSIVNGVKTSLTNLYNNIKTTVENIKSDITTGLTNLWNNIKTITTNIKTTITTAVNNIKTFLTTAGNNIKTVVTNALTNIKTSVTTIINNMKDSISNAIDIIRSLWTTCFNAISSFTSNIFNGIRNTVHSVIDGIVSAVRNMINTISGAISSISNAINNVKSALSGGFSVPNINLPHLAQGAVIPPNREFMAVLGDQSHGVNIETPLDTMIDAFKTALAEEGGGRNSQPIVLQLDGKTVASVVWNETEKKYKQTGKYMPSYA